MRLCRRILAGLTLLLSTVGLLLSLAAGVGVWVVKGPVTTKATWAFERIGTTLDVADQSLVHVKASLARASERLDNVREERRQLSREPQRADAARRFLARTVQQKVAPEIDNAHEKLHTVAEAAVVVNSVLEDMGSFPFLSVTGLDVDQLTEMNGNLSRVESSAWELLRLLGEPGSEAGSDAEARLSQVERALQTMQRLIAEYEPQLAQVRQRTGVLESKTLSWITPAAVIISLTCFWIAISQVSLLAHAWSWWKRRRLTPPAIPT
jgi:hypothetical protein